MKKSISFTVTILLATIGLALAVPDKEAMLAKENAAWQAFKDKKADDFKKVVDHDFCGIYAESISDMAREMSDMAKWDMKSFSISDYKMHSDEKDVVVCTYVVKVEGTYDGKEASGTMNAGTVWKIENGKWLAIFHTNVKQAQ